MKKILIIIALVIFQITSGHSQNLSQVETLYRSADSTLIIKTFRFGLSTPKKVQFNNLNAVLISETQMDSINLKYLKFNLLYSKANSFKLQNELFVKEMEKLNLQLDFFKQDNESLKEINSNNKMLISNTNKIHKNEILYWKEKAKGKFKIFLYGTSIGAIIVLLLTSL